MSRPHVHTLAISIVISLLLVLLLGYVQHLQLNELKQNFENTTLILQRQLSTQEQALVTTANALIAEQTNRMGADINLTEKTNLLNEQLSRLAQQNQEATQQLTGRLNTLKQESEQKIQELTEQVEYNLKSTDFTNIVQKILPSVVSIQTDKSTGSGAIIDARGYIITNYHVIEGATAGSVRTSDKNTHQVRIVATNPAKDLAILQIEGDYTSLKLGNSDGVEVGQRVIAVGSPAGLEFSVNEGIISARRENNGNEYFQTDVALNPGNSGGPLIDNTGKLIGINNFKLKNFEGLNFALTINEAKQFIQTTISSET
ncbi:MAG: trypsin-like peptidase domain-containing protein [Candidatus Woesearchaeota archaeon]|nr:trypsin-like peptidase domain-containing protein [Candidatus Woesearchaeota archaeon]